MMLTLKYSHMPYIKFIHVLYQTEELNQIKIILFSDCWKLLSQIGFQCFQMLYFINLVN